MADLSVVVPTLLAPDETDVVPAIEARAAVDVEVLVRDETPVTRARNEGARRASSDKLVFLDDDSVPIPGYLARVADVLEDEGAVAGRTVHPRDDVIGRRLTGHYDFGDERRYVTRFWGCNMALRREVLAAAGWWDEELGWGHEEKELAERVLRHAPIFYDPALVVVHPYADSVVDYWHKQYRLERQTPAVWARTGVPVRQQLLEIGRFACDPTNYLGLTPRHLAARAGGALATTAGRVRGLLDR